MDAVRAVALALAYLEGIRDGSPRDPTAEAETFVEHLDGSGFMVRARERAEWRKRRPSAWEQRNLTPADLRARRQALGLGLGAFAKKASISVDSLGDIEAGRRAPHVKTLDKILDVLARLEAETR